MTINPKFYDCGICEHYHPIEWNGDCREDSARFTYKDLEYKYGMFGWTEVDMPV